MHIVYKTVNIINEMFYIGYHKTATLDDGYVGSGKYLKSAIKKYGIENFRREVLAVFETEQEAFELEKKLVAKLQGILCYNIHEGGSGGFGWINKQKLNNAAENSRRGCEAIKNKIKTDPILKKKYTELANNARPFRTKYKLYPPIMSAKWRGQHHTPEARKRISIAQSGEGNSNFGKSWMRNESLQKSKPVSHSEIGKYLEDGWVVGRKIYG